MMTLRSGSTPHEQAKQQITADSQRATAAQLKLGGKIRMPLDVDLARFAQRWDQVQERGTFWIVAKRKALLTILEKEQSWPCALAKLRMSIAVIVANTESEITSEPIGMDVDPIASINDQKKAPEMKLQEVGKRATSMAIQEWINDLRSIGRQLEAIDPNAVSDDEYVATLAALINGYYFGPEDAYPSRTQRGLDIFKVQNAEIDRNDQFAALDRVLYFVLMLREAHQANMFMFSSPEPHTTLSVDSKVRGDLEQLTSFLCQDPRTALFCPKRIRDIVALFCDHTR